MALGILLLMSWIAWRFKGTAERTRQRPYASAERRCCSPLAVTAAATYVYFLRVPQTYLTHWKFSVATSYLSQMPDFLPAANVVAAIVLLLTALAGAWTLAACMPVSVHSGPDNEPCALSWSLNACANLFAART